MQSRFSQTSPQIDSIEGLGMAGDEGSEAKPDPFFVKQVARGDVRVQFCRSSGKGG